MSEEPTGRMAELAFELRTLLNSATGMLEVAALTLDPNEQASYYQTALTSSQQASELLNRFLERKSSLHSYPNNSEVALNAAPTTSPQRQLTILLAEDNVINQRIVCKLLERRGHIVKVANNGRIAVDSAAQETFDLILMDIKMPVMDGLDAASFIRANEHNSNARRVPIVALTAVGETELAVISEVMDDVIQKPFETLRFMRTVEAITKNSNVPKS